MIFLSKLAKQFCSSRANASFVVPGSVAAACTRRGAYDYLLLPVKREQLLATMHRALEQRRLKLQDRREAQQES